jgi:hypothetical protein
MMMNRRYWNKLLDDDDDDDVVLDDILTMFLLKKSTSRQVNNKYIGTILRTALEMLVTQACHYMGSHTTNSYSSNYAKLIILLFENPPANKKPHFPPHSKHTTAQNNHMFKAFQGHYSCLFREP